MAENNIRTSKMNAQDMGRVLESCIRNNEPLMIEDMDSTFESILEPLLMK